VQPAHMLKQAPQLWGSLCVSMQVGGVSGLLHRVSESGQPQVPVTQAVVGRWHMLPQPPQLLASLCSSTQFKRPPSPQSLVLGLH
jgi:hypothetical protein